MWLLRTLSLLGWVLTPGCCELSCPPKLTGYVGGSLSVLCCYTRDLEKYGKYWCKGHPILPCLVLVDSQSDRNIIKDRISIRDNRVSQCVEVIMNNLTMADSGDYQCGIHYPFRLDPRCTIHVAVFPATTLDPEERPTTSKPPVWLLTTKQHRMSSSTQPPASHGFTETTDKSHSSTPTGSPGFIFFLIAPGLKTLFLLCLVFAVIWMQRRRRKPSRAGTPNTRMCLNENPLKMTDKHAG